jgi:stress response protein SCP2
MGGAIIIAGAVMLVVSIISMVTQIDKDSTRFVVPGEEKINIAEPGKYMIYYEHQSTIDGKIYSTGNADVSGLGVLVIDAKTEEKIDIGSTLMSSTYTMNGRSGTSMFEFDITEPTEILVIAEYVENEGPDVVLNVSSDITGAIFKEMGAMFGYFFGGLFGGLIVIVVTIIMHLRARKRYRLK